MTQHADSKVERSTLFVAMNGHLDRNSLTEFPTEEIANALREYTARMDARDRLVYASIIVATTSVFWVIVFGTIIIKLLQQ